MIEHTVLHDAIRRPGFMLVYQHDRPTLQRKYHRLPNFLLVTHLAQAFFSFVGCHFMAFTFFAARHRRPPG
jgi:hypothetical protein